MKNRLIRRYFRLSMQREAVEHEKNLIQQNIPKEFQYHYTAREDRDRICCLVAEMKRLEAEMLYVKCRLADRYDISIDSEGNTIKIA